MRKTPVSPVRNLLLTRYAPLADSIAALFFPYAEVVIHDLHAQTVLYLANNLSKREIGDASASDELDHAAHEERRNAPYEKLNWDGRRMRCVSNVLYDDENKPAGMMCISFNIAVFEEARSALDLLIKGAGIVPQTEELFRDDWQDRIHAFLHTWLRERQLGLNGLTREHRRELVAALYEEGAFRGKSSADYVAAVLGMGRATVYKHLKQMKQNSG